MDLLLQKIPGVSQGKLSEQFLPSLCNGADRTVAEQNYSHEMAGSDQQTNKTKQDNDRKLRLHHRTDYKVIMTPVGLDRDNLSVTKTAPIL